MFAAIVLRTGAATAAAMPLYDVYPTGAALSCESSFFHSVDFQPLDFEMLAAYNPANISSYNCDTLASAFGCDECNISSSRVDAAANNFVYNSSAAVAKAEPGDTTLSTTVEHYSSASAALNGEVTDDNDDDVDDDDVVATVNSATCRYSDLTSPSPTGRRADLTVLTTTSLTDTNALFQQLLSSNAMLDELDSDNSTFLQNCKLIPGHILLSLLLFRRYVANVILMTLGNL